MRLYAIGLGIFSILAIGSADARADDWLMFRKDAARTAASGDKLALPLHQAWSWKSIKVGGFAPLSTAVVRGDTVFFAAGPNEISSKAYLGRLLIAADIRTGVVKWSKQLFAPRMQQYLPEDIGPAVTANGVVYMMDWDRTVECVDGGYQLKAFAADTGKLIDSKSVSMKNHLDRLFLRQEDGEPDYLLKSFEKPDC